MTMINYNKIPKELKSKPNWVACGNTKIPINVNTLKGASTSDALTWSTYESAYQTVVQWKMFPYIGFVFDGSGYVGIDIDKGYENGLLNELACDVIGACHSYTEKSKSGRGVHIILKGDLPFDGKNNFDGVEIYKTKRFFVMTGDIVCYSKIIENQPAIDYVVSKYFSNIVSQKVVGASYKLDFGAQDNKISFKYPDIIEGGRNTSLISLGGSLINLGYTTEQIVNELTKVNQRSCKPPLSDRELKNVIKSVMRYKDGR